jgi:transcriptional regulator with XRE-family HTH domain
MDGAPEKVQTSTLLKRLFKTRNLHTFLEQNQAFIQISDFSEYITQLCAARGLVPERVIKQAQIERSYGHQLFNGTRKPSRDKVLQLAFGFGLTVEETQKLLQIACKGALYPRIKRDAVILHCLARQKNLFETQDALAAFGLTLLGGDWKHGD